MFRLSEVIHILINGRHFCSQQKFREMRIYKSALITLLASLIWSASYANGEIPAYYKIAGFEGDMESAIQSVNDALTTNGFIVLGDYSPAGRSDFHVLAFTNDKLQEVTLKVEDRGALASVLKIGFIKEGGRIDISIVNPEYIFYAYLREDADTYNEELNEISEQIKEALSSIGSDWTAFGGTKTAKDLKKYRYMFGMPYFDDPVELGEFGSFDKAVSTIKGNLEEGKGNTISVYEVVLEDENVAIFGVGLLNEEDGEAHFLPIIGPAHIAAMPYEIIVQGTEATMLHGRFRFALHWPELTMGTFTKIMSTPGYVKDTMKALTE